MAVVGPLGGGGQAEAEGGEEVVGRQDVGGAGEVVDLVIDHQTEAVTDAFGVDVEGIVGGDGDGLNLVRASAEESHLGESEVGAEAVMPLEHEVDGGDDDEGVAGGSGDGEVGDERLACAGRQDHEPAAAGPVPCLDGLRLVEPGGSLGGEPECERPVGPCPVVEQQQPLLLGAVEGSEEVAVAGSRRPPACDAEVEGHAGGLEPVCQRIDGAVEHEGAAVEPQGHRGRG